MAGERARAPREAEGDALLTCVVAATCGLGFLVFVALPVQADPVDVPVALEAVWTVGFLVGAFLGPVAAGLAAFISASVLGARGSMLTRRARILHWGTIGLSAGLLVTYVASSAALRTWLD